MWSEDEIDNVLDKLRVDNALKEFRENQEEILKKKTSHQKVVVCHRRALAQEAAQTSKRGRHVAFAYIYEIGAQLQGFGVTAIVVGRNTGHSS